jgi:hypothetical protein
MRKPSGRRRVCCGNGSGSTGIPLALYTDWKNVYVREPTEKEQTARESASDAVQAHVPVTQFRRMCQKLDIRIIVHNARFAREPTAPQDYHRKAPPARELDQVFCLETERSISNDWVVRYENRWFQLERTSDCPPRQAKVTVCEWEDGRIEIRYKAKARPHPEMAAPQPVAEHEQNKTPLRRSRWKPPVDHLWRSPAMLRAVASASP